MILTPSMQSLLASLRRSTNEFLLEERDMRELLDFCRSRQNIFCYGAGIYGRMLRCFLDEHGIDIKGFVVSGKSNEENVLGIPVYSFGKIVTSIKKGAVLVGVGRKYRDEIVDMLLSHNIKNYFVLSDEMIDEMRHDVNYEKTYQTNHNVCVLLYHRICHLSVDTWRLANTPEVFEEHIKFLKENYDILRFEDAWEPSSNRSVVITFDDGYADNFLYALPILEKYKVPATIFVSTINIGTTNEFWWDELERIICCNPRLPGTIQYAGRSFRVATDEEREKACYALHPILKAMLPDNREKVLHDMAAEWKADKGGRPENRALTKDELRELSSSPYITIGGHTVTHSSLAFETEDLQKHEIEKSKADIEKIIGKKIDVFSHPFGQKEDFTAKTVEIAKACGYKKVAAAYGGVTGANESDFYIPRNGIVAGTRLAELKRHVRGLWCLFG